MSQIWVLSRPVAQFVIFAPNLKYLMQVNTKAIVLTTLKYGESSLIVKAYTASDGLKGYLLKGVLSAKKSTVKSAYFQPLSQLEIVANHKNKGTLESIREARIDFGYHTLHTDISKNAMTLFIAEILVNSIHEEEPNPALFEFLQLSLQWFDTHNESSNFHLYFMLRLTKYLGFYPDLENMGATYFDLLEGGFVNGPSHNPMVFGEQLSYFKSFLGINFDALPNIKMNKKNRHELLKHLILYFELHLQGFRKPRSLAVLNQVFS